MRYLQGWTTAAVLAVAVTVPTLTLSGRTAAPAAVSVGCGRRLPGLRPAAGRTITLQRGCRYAGPLTVRASHVTVTAAGQGPLPVITRSRDGAAVAISGRDDVLEHVALQGRAPQTWSCGGGRTPAGHVDGVDLRPGSRHDTVADVRASGFYAGIYVWLGSDDNTIRSDTLAGNNQLSTNNKHQSSGAFGILLWGSRNLIEYNTIDGNRACSLAFGHDGSAVEVYGGSGNVIRWNRGQGNPAFTELGSSPQHAAAGNAFDHNTVTDGPDGERTVFLITRGSRSPSGPVYGTYATGNRVTLTRHGDQGAISYGWRPGNGTLLTLTRNHLALGSNQALFEDGGYVNGGGNIITGTCNPRRAC